MTEHVGTLNEFGGNWLDCKLYLTKIFLHVDDIDEDIVGAQLQPILDSYYLHYLWLFQADLVQIFENLQYFSLLGTAFTSHEVTYLETKQIWRRSPPRLSGQFGIIQIFRDLKQAVNDTVEIEDDVTVQVVYSLVWKLTTGLLEFFNVCKSIFLQFSQQ